MHTYITANGMKVNVIKADLSYLDRCAEILQGSKLGMTYFTGGDGAEYHGKELLKDGFEQDDLYVALDEEENCLGFVWIQINGMFNWFPFLHVVVVDQKYRGQGIGKKLMEFFDQIAFEEDGSQEAFLMVGDYNREAIALYEKFGYQQVGAVPDLFIVGITEYLMMKRV